MRIILCHRFHPLSVRLENKKAQLWLRNPRDATAFQIHQEEIHRNDDDDDDDDVSFTSRRNERSVRLLWLHTA